MFFYGFDLMYFVYIAPGLILAAFASMMTKSTFAKYSQVGSRRGYTGYQAAYEMLRRSGVFDVRIERVNGMLTDHYDPSSKTLRLSDSVYDSPSLSAIGVACHEAGHALQHAHGYSMLALRSFLVPVTNICSTLYVWVIIIGALMHAPQLQVVGVVMCMATVFFALVTLPVEWDASARAKVAMVETGLVSGDEAVAAGKVLNAAFLTYVASAVTSLLVLLYWLMRLGLLGGRRD